MQWFQSFLRYSVHNAFGNFCAYALNFVFQKEFAHTIYSNTHNMEQGLVASLVFAVCHFGKKKYKIWGLAVVCFCGCRYALLWYFRWKQIVHDSVWRICWFLSDFL